MFITVKGLPFCVLVDGQVVDQFEYDFSYDLMGFFDQQARSRGFNRKTNWTKGFQGVSYINQITRSRIWLAPLTWSHNNFVNINDRKSEYEVLGGVPGSFDSKGFITASTAEDAFYEYCLKHVSQIQMKVYRFIGFSGAAFERGLLTDRGVIYAIKEE